jgi:tetratricopeptide (TPR) repeat protein
MRYPDGKLARPQDQMIDDIIVTSKWEVPIEFAVTCSEENRVFRGQSLDDHLEINGMMYRLKRESGSNMIDVEGTKDLYLNKFKYRGVADPKVYKDENTDRLTTNYASGFLYCADRMRRNGDNESAIEMVKGAMKVLPHQWQIYGFLAQLYSEMDSLSRVDDILREAPADVDLSQVWTTLAHSYWTRDEKPKAYAILNSQLGKDPNDHAAYSQMVTYFFRDSLYDSLQTLIERWLTHNPSDTDAYQALEEVRRITEPDSLMPGVRVRQVDTVRGSTPSDSN